MNTKLRAIEKVTPKAVSSSKATKSGPKRSATKPTLKAGLRKPGKRNWSGAEANNDRKPHAAHYAARTPKHRPGPVALRTDRLAVTTAFLASTDPNRAHHYNPPIIGKSICR